MVRLVFEGSEPGLRGDIGTAVRRRGVAVTAEN